MADDPNVSYGPIYGTPCIVVDCKKEARYSAYVWNIPVAKQAKHDFCIEHAEMIGHVISAHNRANLDLRQHAEIRAFNAATEIEAKLNKFFLTGVVD